MRDKTHKAQGTARVLPVLAGVLGVFLLVTFFYVGYQAMHILFPQNVYETALPAVVSDSIDADGVLLFQETYVSGSGNLGYLAADGERVSAGTAVAEIYSNPSQATLRQQLTQLNEQIGLLQKSQNTTSLQLDSLLRERSSALYDLMDALDTADYTAVDGGVSTYLLAQNKLWIVTWDAASFTDQITTLPSRHRTCRRSWAPPPRSPLPRPATSSVPPASDGSTPVRRTSLHRMRGS